MSCYGMLCYHLALSPFINLKTFVLCHISCFQSRASSPSPSSSPSAPTSGPSVLQHNSLSFADVFVTLMHSYPYDPIPFLIDHILPFFTSCLITLPDQVSTHRLVTGFISYLEIHV